MLLLILDHLTKGQPDDLGVPPHIFEAYDTYITRTKGYFQRPWVAEDFLQANQRKLMYRATSHLPAH